jgi:hypothetical protein
MPHSGCQSRVGLLVAVDEKLIEVEMDEEQLNQGYDCPH